jgi:hypothetical protein
VTSKTSHTPRSEMNSSLYSPASSINRSGVKVFGRIAGAVGYLPKGVLLGVIGAYRWLLSPLMPPACRFEPTCSVYARASVERFGALRGGWLATKRLCRCHPFSRHSGCDPVPGTRLSSSSSEIDV